MSKGGNWERDVCKFLSKWINGSEKPFVFWRGRGSGAMFTLSEGNAGEAFSGDIYAVRDEGKFLTQTFSIEAKNGYASASLDKFLKYNKSDPLKSFWIQCVDDAVKSNKYPMLIYKQKGSPTPWVGIDFNAYEKLKIYLTDTNWNPIIRMIRLNWAENLRETILFEYKEFFHTIKPEYIKGALLNED